MMLSRLPLIDHGLAVVSMLSRKFFGSGFPSPAEPEESSPLSILSESVSVSESSPSPLGAGLKSETLLHLIVHC